VEAKLALAQEKLPKRCVPSACNRVAVGSIGALQRGGSLFGRVSTPGLKMQNALLDLLDVMIVCVQSVSAS
jgi:hypothetical protein